MNDITKDNNQQIQPMAEDDSTNRLLDEKLMELQSLFEVSQTLNSSLNLKSILDNMLLTPMGKMLITRGIVLLYSETDDLFVETLKGLNNDLIGQKIDLNIDIKEPLFLDEIIGDDYQGLDFLKENNIKLLVPIRSSDHCLGVIGFGKKITGQSYSKPEIDYLKSLSNIAATSIENGKMVMRLREVNRRLDKKIQELNTLFEIGKELNSTLDIDKILNLLSYAIMGEMLVNKCMIFLEENGEMSLMMEKGGQEGGKINKFQDKKLLAELINLKDPIILNRDDEYEWILNYFKKMNYPLIVPMQLQNQTRGVMAIGERITKTEFASDELEFLLTLGNEALICLENARLFEEKLEKQRMEEELAVAREIQQRLLPREFPKLDSYEISGINVSSLHVSGDYFDCIQLDENRYCVAIADVSGKGTPASLLMANLQAVLNVLITTEIDLDKMAGKINNLIHKNTNYDKFITFFFGIFDISDNSFTYVNAGHNPPFWVKNDGEVELLDKGGLLLGMMSDAPYEKETIKLAKADWIVMFTDGVTEAQNKDEEDFEEDRLQEVVLNNLSKSAEEMQVEILNQVKLFTGNMPQGDDITVLIIKVS